MIWAIISMMCVLGTKLVTSLRIKDLKERLASMKPRIIELRGKLEDAEGEYETIKSKEEALEARLNHLRDAVRILESLLKEPATSKDNSTSERLQVLQSVEGNA
jgi:chromosome segregation ATPase